METDRPSSRHGLVHLSWHQPAVAMRTADHGQNECPSVNVLTHNPGKPLLAKRLKRYMPVLCSSSRMRKAVTLPPTLGGRECVDAVQTTTPKQEQDK